MAWISENFLSRLISLFCTDAKTIQNAILQNVEIGSTIHTDEAGAYVGVGGMSFDHDTVNHSQGEYVRDDVTTNGIESVFAVVCPLKSGPP